MWNNKILILIISMILMLGMVSATTYYVDPATGNDTHTGLDWANAWATAGSQLYDVPAAGIPPIEDNAIIIIKENSV